MEPQKPRGRARGRARQVREETRRPGNGTERGGETAQPAAVHPQQGNGGRRTHRGVSRSDTGPTEQKPPSPTQMEGVTQAMAGASLSETATGRGRSSVGAGNDNTRPSHVQDKKGNSGEEIRLYANYFELLSKPTWRIYQYHCDFAPVVESSRMRRAFMREHKETLGNCYLFDGMSDLKTATQLGESLEVFSKRTTDGENIQINLKRVNELAPSHPELQRLFNTQMRRNLQHLKFQLLGRHYFDPSAVNEVQQYNLQIWQGVITSIRQHEERVMMCVDTVHKVVRKETALQMIKGIAESSRGNYRDDCIKELAGLIVMTRYNNRTYRIDDIDWTLNPTKTFEARDGPITYLKYYKQQYEIDVRDHGQPLLLCTSKEKEIKRGASVPKKIYLIPEFCVMTGITDAMRANFTTMKELGNLTRVNPQKRVDHLNTFIRRVSGNQEVKTEMNAWGLQFAESLVKIRGRMVPCEQIGTGRAKRECPRDKDFTMLIRSDPMVSAVDLRDWVVIFTNRDRDRTSEMLGTLQSVANNLGMRISKPRMCEIRDDRINTYFNAFKETFQHDTTQMVMFILPNNKKERYDALKKYTCVDVAVPSQCILSRTIGKPKGLMTVATKVAIQLNCKLGGVPWALSIPIKLRIMICGYDTYHDSSRKGRSAGAFVASLNSECTQWYSKVAFHSAGGWEELSNHLKVNFSLALKKYYEVNKALPELILMYRDGVGDGQVRYVREWEIKQFTEVINDKLRGRDTRWGFIIVNKKINTRFFRVGGNNMISNPPHGTVVDTVVTRYDRYDFFLVSQMAIQGTVSPTMYNVIEDRTCLKPEYIQRLTYKLTHLYFNCSGTISVPAPCQYAHKLAFLAGQSLHTAPKEELCDKLFYL